MQKLNQDHVALKMYPGLIDWLGYQKDPDALVCKLLSDYRHRHPTTTTLRKASNTFCAIIAGVMLGYGWCVYHVALPVQAPQVITYPDIAIDLTSWKYKTARY